ncbi:hypothetical protein PMZ80_001344 [Knufia obscura]|uniref:Uncharacterized protein n=2 Tax=Knufia TaxID=430999 RepID=A0AAN8I7Q1_9EURO|nr:hypothetical protein PMZ80_001344 [Knufia obscura]KAK5956254.1 hypothetical protein OHC33_002830 [Knufia fluminis]
MNAYPNQILINQLIDRATITSIENAQMVYQQIRTRRSSKRTTESEKVMVAKFERLFSNLTRSERHKRMMEIAPLKVKMGREPDAIMIDEGALRAWLQEVAEIMVLSDSSEVERMLGVI